MNVAGIQNSHGLVFDVDELDPNLGLDRVVILLSRCHNRAYSYRVCAFGRDGKHRRYVAVEEFTGEETELLGVPSSGRIGEDPAGLFLVVHVRGGG